MDVKLPRVFIEHLLCMNNAIMYSIVICEFNQTQYVGKEFGVSVMILLATMYIEVKCALSSVSCLHV